MLKAAKMNLARLTPALLLVWSLALGGVIWLAPGVEAEHPQPALEAQASQALGSVGSETCAAPPGAVRRLSGVGPLSDGER